MCANDEEPEAALAHGSFRQTGDADLPIVSSGGAHRCEPGLGLRADPACSLGLSSQGCEPFCETVPCSRNQRRLASAPLRGTELTKDIAELAATVKNKVRTSLLHQSR